jgi:hypothetical protein
MSPKESIAQGGGNFPPTRWSVVAAVRSDDSAERTRALDVLFAAYWKPVYKYIRLKFSMPREEAQDLVQGFFAELLERDLLSRWECCSAWRSDSRRCFWSAPADSDSDRVTEFRAFLVIPHPLRVIH